MGAGPLPAAWQPLTPQPPLTKTRVMKLRALPATGVPQLSKASTSLAVLLTTLVAASPCLAETGEDYLADYEVPPARHRDGFTVGMFQGFGVTHATGFPNEVQKIGDDEFRATALGLGSGGNFYAGAAIRDWFLFGVGMNFASTYTSELVYSGGSIMVHLEGYPFYPLGGVWENLGIYTDLGLGGGAILDGEEIVGEGGGTGLVGLGVILEQWRFGYFNFGPVVQYSHTFVASLQSNALSFGVRAAFYPRP